MQLRRGMHGMGLSKVKLIVPVGLPLCHARNEDGRPKAILGISEEFQVGSELYVL